MGNMFSISCSIDDTIRCCWDFTVRQATYTCKLDENHKELKDAVEELRAQRNDLKLEVELAEQKLLKQLNEVQLWLSRAETLITEVEELIDVGSQEIDKACFASCCSTNCKSSYKLGKKIARKCKEIAILKSQGVFDKVAVGRPPAQVEVMPFQPTVGQESTFDEVWSCLIEKDVGLIGLHGLGGVGKTTLLSQINNNFDSIPDGFDVVIWVVVSKDYTIEKVQEKIGEKIGLSDNQLWVNKSSYEKCNDIFEVLSRKKFVILLDDVWERVDLMKIGIPVPSKNGSKLVFTTRKLSVCGEMEAQRIIEVKCLGSEEALKLFEEKVGHETLASDPEIPKLAKTVVAECDGLPLALVTIGRAMAYKRSPQSWRNAIAKLQQSAHEKMERVYHLLKFSFDSLDNDKTRSCLLYCGLYPEDYMILKSDLINHCIFEGFLGEFRNLSSAQYEGYDIIDSLVSASLLEKEGNEHVKMHDVVRDMALWIANTGEAQNTKFFVQAGAQLTEAPEFGEWKGVERMSLMQNKIRKLVGKPECSALKTLFLNQNMLKVIDDGFFHSMSNLTVLNLSGNINLKELPKDISGLISLECLNLSGTGVKELPMQLRALVNLKYLGLNRLNLRRIPQKLISSFSKLQAFMMNSPTETFIEIVEDNVLSSGDNDSLIEELGGLQHLDMLSMGIKYDLAFRTLLCFPKLKGCIQELLLVLTTSEILHLEDMERLEKLQFWYCKSPEIKIQTSWIARNACFNSLRHVVLSDCPEVRELTWLIHVPNLRTLDVMDCKKVEKVISEVVEKPNPFPVLEHLYLRYLPELKSVYWDALPFQHLIHVLVLYCPKLKKLPLKSDSAKKENFIIHGQKMWWEALEWENEAARNVFLPHFKHV